MRSATPLGANYRRLWTASALSNLADGVFQIALPLLALRLTDSPGLIAGVALAGRLPWLLFALQAGALADRLDRRTTMVNVDFVRVALMGTLAVVVAFEAEQLIVLYAVAFALGIGETLFDTAAQSVMPSIVGRDELSRANGRLYAVELTMNSFIGPPLGGVLAATAMALAFAGSAACYLVAAFALLAIRGNFRPERVGPTVRLRTDIAEGLRYLFGHRLLRALAFMVGIQNLGFTASFAVLPVYAVGESSEIGLSEGGFGILLTTLAIGSLAGSALAAPAERLLGRANALAASVVLGAIAVVVPGLTSNVVAIGIGFAGSGVAMVVWNVITVSLRQRIAPDHLLGRVNAGYRLLAWGTQPVGAALAGVLAELTSVRAVFIVMAIPMALLILFRGIITDAAIDAADPATDEPVAAL